MYTFIVDVCSTSSGRSRNTYCPAIGQRTATAPAQRYRSTIGDDHWHRWHGWRRKLLFVIGNANNATQSWQQQWMQFERARTTLSFTVFESIRSEIAIGKFARAKKRRRRFPGEFTKITNWFNCETALPKSNCFLSCEWWGRELWMQRFDEFQTKTIRWNFCTCFATELEMLRIASEMCSQKVRKEMWKVKRSRYHFRDYRNVFRSFSMIRTIGVCIKGQTTVNSPVMDDKCRQFSGIATQWRTVKCLIYFEVNSVSIAPSELRSSRYLWPWWGLEVDVITTYNWWFGSDNTYSRSSHFWK